jgi:hypothetical protein
MLSTTFALAALAVGAGMFTSQAAAGPTPNEGETAKETECPPEVRGVAVAVKQVPGGVMLEFTAPSKQQLQELQLLLREGAAAVEYHSKVAALHANEMAARDADQIPPVDVSVKQRPGGAQVIIRAEQPQDGGAVLEQAQTFKRFWDASRCISGREQDPNRATSSLKT